MATMTALGLLAVTAMVWFIQRLVSERLYFRRLKSQGLPMPPHNPILGHLPVLMRTVRSLPADAHPLYLSTRIRETYPDLGPNFYLDLWPFAPSMLVVGSPEIMHHIAFDHVLGKNDVLKNYLRPLTEGMDIVSMNGPSWKKWRTIFNPGFSPAHLMTLIPLIVKETEVFCTLLDEHAEKGEVFKMKPLTDNLILDVIGQVALKVRFNCQTTYNPFIHSLRTQIKWLSTGLEPNLFDRYHPLRPLMHWYHGRIVDKYVITELNRHFEAWSESQVETAPPFSSPDILEKPSKAKGNRSVIDLALKAYTDTQSSTSTSSSKTTPNKIDPHFHQICKSQLKVFLFSGHDTTSSSITFQLYLLTQNPEALTNLQNEHTQIFGSDPAQAAAKISSNPHLLNQLPYTTGVIKEALRLFPTVTVSRQPEPGLTVVDRQQNHIFPADRVVIWPNQHSSHHDPAYWPRAREFLPERWIVGPADPLFPVKGMWRAFEQGPRACIAQELAMLEMKIVLVLVVRRFRVLDVYELIAGGKGVVQAVHGVRAYQVEEMAPKDGLPVRVERIGGS